MSQYSMFGGNRGNGRDRRSNDNQDNQNRKRARSQDYRDSDYHEDDYKRGSRGHGEKKKVKQGHRHDSQDKRRHHHHHHHRHRSDRRDERRRSDDRRKDRDRFESRSREIPLSQYAMDNVSDGGVTFLNSQPNMGFTPAMGGVLPNPLFHMGAANPVNYNPWPVQFPQPFHFDPNNSFRLPTYPLPHSQPQRTIRTMAPPNHTRYPHAPSNPPGSSSSIGSFSVDKKPSRKYLDYKSLTYNNRPNYGQGTGQVEGTEIHDLSKVYSFYSKHKAVKPVVSEESDGESNEIINLEHVNKEHMDQTEDSADESFDFLRLSSTSFNEFDQGSHLDTKLSRDDENAGSLKDKIADFNSRLSKERNNIQLWKEFIEFQDVVFQHSADLDESNHESTKQKKDRRKRNQKALQEKKIAIVDKALKDNDQNLELHILRLNLMNSISRSKDVLKEWKKVALSHQKNESFWNEYLRFASSNRSIYSTTVITNEFKSTLEKFRSMYTLGSAEKPDHFEFIVFDTIFSFGVLLRNSGFNEKCACIHQGMIELEVGVNKEPELSFEDYWEQETPKFGQSNSLSWCNYALQKKTTLLSDSGVPEDLMHQFEDSYFSDKQQSNISDQVSMKDIKWETWLTIEMFRSKTHWLPACSEDDCDDPQRLVLYSDIAPFTIMPLGYNHARRFRLVFCFLLSIQEDWCPRTHVFESILPSFSRMNLTMSSSLFKEVNYWEKLFSLYVEEGCVHKTTSYRIQFPQSFKLWDFNSPNHYICDDDYNNQEKTDDRKSFKLLIGNAEIQDSRLNLLKTNFEKFSSFIRGIIAQAIDILSPEYASLLVRSYIQWEQKNCFESHRSITAPTKFVKKLLKKEKLRNEIILYHELALLEYYSGNKAAAIELTLKALNIAVKEFSYSDFNKDVKKVATLTKLYRNLCEFYLCSDEKKALHVLACLGKGFQIVEFDVMEELNGTGVLRIKKFFENMLEPALEWRNNEVVEHLLLDVDVIVELTSTYALFKSLVEGFDSACSLYEKILNSLKVDSSLGKSTNYSSYKVYYHHVREQLYIHWCNLGARALAHNPLTNSKFRNILEQALNQFPSSPPLLLVFTNVENQCSIAGRLWRQMMNIIQQECSSNSCIQWTSLIIGMGLARKVEEIENDEEVGLDVFGLGGPSVPMDTIFYKIDSLFELSEKNSALQCCPLLWRIHLKLLALRAVEGKNGKRAQAIFYDAINICPFSKSIYLDAFLYFPDLREEILSLIKEKEIYIRLPEEELEVLLGMDTEEDREKAGVSVERDMSEGEIED